MQFYFDKVWKERVSPPPGYAPDQGFASRKLAMELVGHTGNWRMFNQIPGLDWDVQLLPSGPYSQAGGEMALEAIGVSNKTPHLEACWRFLKFMMSKPAIRAHVDAGYLSIRKSVADETHLSAAHSANPRNVAAAYEALAVARSMPHGADFIEIALDVIQPEIDRMLVDPNADVAAACRRATRAADDFLATIGTERKPPTHAPATH
jgi:ABC-type glycerol-3-phosphate transport system substrate-binding protein